jgi:hypothetical protein
MSWSSCSGCRSLLEKRCRISQYPTHPDSHECPWALAFATIFLLILVSSGGEEAVHPTSVQYRTFRTVSSMLEPVPKYPRLPTPPPPLQMEIPTPVHTIGSFRVRVFISASDAVSRMQERARSEGFLPNPRQESTAWRPMEPLHCQ